MDFFQTELAQSQVHTDAMALHRLQATTLAARQRAKDGHWFANLIRAKPQVVKGFSDHEEVVAKLEEAREIEALAEVASGGYVPSETSRLYRDGFYRAVG